MKLHYLRSVIIILAIAVTGVACNDSSTGPDADPETGTVEGQVAAHEDESQNKSLSALHVEDAIVTAATVNADGSLEMISESADTTNAEGEFSLEIAIDAVSDDQQLVIVAEKNGEQWKSFLTAEVEGGSTVKVQPLTVESSGEADVYAEVIAGDHTDNITQADIELFVESETGAEIRGSSDAASSFAQALAQEAEARAAYFAEQSVEVTGEQAGNIREAKIQAQIELENSLNATPEDDEEGLKAIRETFVTAVAEAYMDAGEIEASAYAEARQVSGDVLLLNTDFLSTEARSEIRACAGHITAYAIDSAVRAQLEGADASGESVEAASQAGATLRNELSDTTAVSEEEIDSAFEAYNQAVVDILQQEFSASAEAIVSANSSVNDSNGAKATLEAALTVAADTDAVIAAYSAYRSAIEAAVESTLDSAGETEAEVVADILILVNLAN